MYQIGTTLTQFILEEQRKHASATGEFSCVLNDLDGSSNYGCECIGWYDFLYYQSA